MLTTSVGFTAHYRAIFGISKNQQRGDPTKQLLPDGTIHDHYYRGHSGIAASGVDGLVFWFLFVKQDSPSTSPNCPRYSEADAQDTIRKYGHLAVGPDYTFNDLWELRLNANMLPLEEGIVQTSWNTGGRVVMVGDAVFKVESPSPLSFLPFDNQGLADGHEDSHLLTTP